jgi:predicted RecB family nuclease
MKNVDGKIFLSPTDLSNHLGCKHLTELNREVALGKRQKPSYKNLTLEALAERGLAHERAYVDYLRSANKTVIELTDQALVPETISLMEKGVDIIVQAALSDDNWSGRADLLIKVDKPSPAFGSWSYEAADTKLAVDTKAGTILQLSVYSDIVSQIQGVTPEHMYVIKPGHPFQEDRFRFDDYKAYYRQFRDALVGTVKGALQDTYPEPVEQCNICRWWKECDKKRHADDHLSLIANVRKTHIGEIEKHNVYKLEEFAQLDKPLPGKPERGTIDSYVKVHEQAKIQFKGRGCDKPLYELLLPFVEKKGFNRLPEPDEGDVYFDFEGDPFYPDGGLEYLFGIVFKENNQTQYKAFWALTRLEEKKAFDDFMTFIMERWQKYPGMHIYHYSPYEPAAIKRLMSRYAIRERDVDSILRGQRFVDLYSISKEILRASVESYSIKNIEKLANYKRKCDLEIAGPARRTLEYILEFKTPDSIDPQTKVVVEEYNEDDCMATEALHTWLEKVRSDQVTGGADLKRPVVEDGNAKEKTKAREEELRRLHEELIAGINADPEQRTEEEKARWLLAHLVHYFDRENKNAWWEFFHVHKMELEDLYEEKSAIAGLTFIEELQKTKKQKKSRYKYRFPTQEVGVEAGCELHEVNGDKVGTLEEISEDERTIVIAQEPGITPYSVHAIKIVSSKVLEDSLLTVIRQFKDHSITDCKTFKAAADLLLRRYPDFTGRVKGEKLIKNLEKTIDEAIALAAIMNDTVLAIQGPPGTGKTYTGAKVILALARQGKRIGVTAVSHKVIRNLLDKVNEFARNENVVITLVHKPKESGNGPAWITEVDDTQGASDAIQPGTVVGGTSFLWADNRAEDKLDYLFVDEAGQMSLANVLAASRSAKNLVLLGDPQQLEQPQKGAHPEGSDVAALTHFINGQQTIRDDMGIFLGVTYRLHPVITAFTSELYYKNRLQSKLGLENLGIHGDTPFAGAGLFYVPINHSGRQTSSLEEVKVIQKVATEFISNKVQWTNRDGETFPITEKDILIVAPYNAQVNALSKCLPRFRIGTVDKFQGQEAAIVIYSVTCSSAEDAPRGMEFLYSPNRLNVATSRAQCVCILVGSEKVFEAACRNVDEMRWVNGFCRFREMATCVAGAAGQILVP